MDLPEHAKKQAQTLVDEFKSKMAEVTKETIEDFYCDVAMYIEDDSWHNYRRDLLNGLKDYHTNAKNHDFKAIRAQMFLENKEEVIKDIGADIVDEIEELKKQVLYLQTNYSPRHSN